MLKYYFVFIKKYIDVNICIKEINSSDEIINKTLWIDENQKEFKLKPEAAYVIREKTLKDGLMNRNIYIWTGNNNEEETIK